MKLLGASLSLSIISIAAGTDVAHPSRAAFVKRALKEDFQSTHNRNLGEDFELDSHPNFRRRHVSLVNHPSDRRQNEQDFTKEENCDQALLSCLPEEQCAACFRFLYDNEVQWSNVAPDTPCTDVLSYLADQLYCEDMHDNQAAKDAFCKSFSACAVWEDDETDDGADDVPVVDCDALTECDWPDMHKSFIGDGICHDGMGGCYNTAICGYDGGDCCEDTCESKAYAECGHDGYVCVNPNSTSCDPVYTLACEHNPNIPDENNPNPADTKCEENETKYRVVMYDTFGDGWDQTSLLIAPKDDKTDIKYKGGLEKGSTGSRYICLPSESTCIHVEVNGGEWGNEVSWEVKPMTTGAPALAAGGAPMSCDFAVGGKACDNTCTGKADVKPNNDPEYKQFKDMYNCIEEKCTIQVGACEDDDACAMCLSEDKADFCYGSDEFLAVVDCTMCSCTDRKESEFCHQKMSPGMVPANPNNENGRESDGSPRACSPAETMKGSDAVLTFAQCTKIDEVSMLVTGYDENKFGLLDQFEACAHSFYGEENHGGHTALGCLQILVNAMGYDDEAEDENAQAISALAELLYRHAGDFCDCASKASADCPLCSNFIHVKTLLYESLDACHSLDEIDCDAWSEFYGPCKKKFVTKFGSVDFSQDGACDYVHDGCEGVGPFPAFRRLDCEDELSDKAPGAWDFWNMYASACRSDDDNSKPTPSGKDVTVPPVPPTTKAPTAGQTPSTPKPAPSPITPRPTTKPYTPPDSANKKPYVPPEGGSSSSSSSASDFDSSSGKKSHFFRNFFFLCVIGGAGFVYYKRRTDAFSFVRYRNTRNYAGGESEMYSAPYSGLTMDSGSGAFQPPSLPPTPSAIDGSMNY